MYCKKYVMFTHQLRYKYIADTLQISHGYVLDMIQIKYDYATQKLHLHGLYMYIYLINITIDNG